MLNTTEAVTMVMGRKENTAATLDVRHTHIIHIACCPANRSRAVIYIVVVIVSCISDASVEVICALHLHWRPVQTDSSVSGVCTVRLDISALVLICMWTVLSALSSRLPVSWQSCSFRAVRSRTGATVGVAVACVPVCQQWLLMAA